MKHLREHRGLVEAAPGPHSLKLRCCQGYTMLWGALLTSEFHFKLSFTWEVLNKLLAVALQVSAGTIEERFAQSIGTMLLS